MNTEKDHVESIRVGSVLAYTDTASGGIRVEVDCPNADGGVDRHRLLISEEGVIYDLYDEDDVAPVQEVYSCHFND